MSLHETTTHDSPAISAEHARLVLEVSRALAVTTDLDALLNKIAQATTQLLDVERASIFLHDPKRDQLWTKVALLSSEIRVPASAGIVGCTFSSNEVQLVPDAYKDSRFNPEPDKRSGFVTRNILSAPMVNIDRKPLGVIQAVNKRNTGFDPQDLLLIQLLADQAGVALQRYNLQLRAMEAVALRKEMDIARHVQQAMLPRSMPQIPGIQTMGWTRPASVTGGDCFDLWPTRDGRLGIFLADAAGHGLGPTLIVSQVRTLTRALSEFETDPSKLLTLVNRRISEDLEPHQFVTAFLGFLASDGTLHYASAGHGPLICRLTPDHSSHELQPTDLPIGIDADTAGRIASPVRLAPGGTLTIVSDGIFEAKNPAGEQYGMERVIQRLDETCGHPPEHVIATLRQDVTTFQGGGDPVDDQTAVACRIVPP